MPTYVSILRIPQMIWVWRATVKLYTDRGKPKNAERNLSHCHFVHHKPTWNDPGPNTHLRGDRPSTNDLSHGTVYSYLIKHCMSEGVCHSPKSIGLCERCSIENYRWVSSPCHSLQKQTRYRGLAGGQILVSVYPRLSSSLFPIRPGT
jgi:hypothetical protein